MNYQFVGYMPDSDPTLPGVITDCAAIVPSMKGMKGAPGPVSAGLSALAAACRGAAVLTKLDETNRFLAGTTAKLYEASGTSWTDRTRASGGDYGAGADVRWRFAQFGNVSLAAIKSDILQASTSGAFANVGASIPKFGIVETVGQFVFGLDSNDQGGLLDSADSPDRWWCCAKGDYTNWTPSTSTECASGRLTSSPGKIRAGRRFGDYIVVYKERSIFLGVYVGPPTVWEFKEIPGEVGALSQEVVVNVGTPESPRHIFMGYEDFYSFDGVRPVPIGRNKVKVKVFSEINRARASNCIALHDKVNGLIYFYYPVADSVNPDKCVVYNYRVDKWGRDDRSIEAAVEYVESGITYGELGDDYSTYGDLPTDVTYGSVFWAASFPTPAVFNTSHVVQTLNGASTTSTITTGDIGDDSNEILISRAKPRYLTAPSSASMVNYYRQNIGDSLTTDATTTQSASRFDVLREARWHRLRFDFTGDVELPGFILDASKQGDE